MRMSNQFKTNPPKVETDLCSLDFLEWAEMELIHNRKIKLHIGGGSMSPTIENGEIVSVEPADPSSIRIGDIVLLSTLSNTALIHRVVSIEADPYGQHVVTRGDNCKFEDIPVPIERVMGRAVAVERNGETIPLVRPETGLRLSIRSLLLRDRNGK